MTYSAFHPLDSINKEAIMLRSKVCVNKLSKAIELRERMFNQAATSWKPHLLTPALAPIGADYQLCFLSSEQSYSWDILTHFYKFMFNI